MLNRLASQMNLMSTSSSSEMSDQCFLESNFFPEIGSLCQSGGNPVLINSCSKYLSSPFKMRSASFTECFGFHGISLGKRASIACSEELSPPCGDFAARELKKNRGE